MPRAVGAAPAVGDTYVASKAGTADASWTGLGGQAVSLHELLVWDGTNWDGAGTAASARTAWQGKVDITAAKPSGYVAATGDLVEVSKIGTLHADWTTVPAGVVVGSVLIYNGTGWVLLNKPLEAATESAAGVVRLATDAEATAGTATNRAVTPAQLKANVPTVAAATVTKAGIVQLADGAAITAGTAGRIVDAAQLKAAAPADASTTVKGIVQLADGVAITAGTAGRVVDAAQLKAAAPADASTTVKGVVQLADAGAITAGTAGLVVDAAQLKAAVGESLGSCDGGFANSTYGGAPAAIDGGDA